MTQLKQTFSWWSFRRDDIEAAAMLSAAAAIGYAGVEMPPEEIWTVARDNGLRIATIVGHQSLSDGLNARANHDRIERELRRNIEKAVANDIPNLIVFSGNRRGLSDDVGAAATADCLRRVAGDAEAAGVTLVLELLNSKVDHADYQADRTDWGVAICESVGSPRVKLLYDIYHMQIMEGDVIRTIRNHHDAIGHYHTAGVPGRADLDDQQELYYPAIARAILETGYEGFFGHEFRPKGDPIAALEAAYGLCAGKEGVA
jgi:hydroxypyruvate isomerase